MRVHMFHKEDIDAMYKKYSSNPILRDMPPPIPGWENLFDSLLLELMVYMETNNVELEIIQCKVKWGMLRVYVQWRDELCKERIPEEVHKIIMKHETLSTSICKICGSTKQESVVESKIKLECMEHYGDRRS